ncbi:M23 family metallopeptidase [Micromonospora sp. NBC_01796]|uniref:M23 family metallopeptidase n=1 Tax=Micromonospora sp. NBC_01796 TaxID=2975987 RepID=UPI002DD7C77E|nr:M23 family metallopeptidase [Micromonospora sp. NBC_01796]WSA88387.1 M23 family metallopeptidase [Micromonospora sp. NBC_01796]
MARDETGTRRLIGRRAAYPMVVLLLAGVAAAGCAQSRPAVWSSPTTPGSATPATVAAAPPPATPSVTPAGTPSASPTASRYVFPVNSANASYHPTHSAYAATDIFASCGTPVLAVTDGEILEVTRVDEYRKNGPQGPLNGGKAVSLLGDDGVRYYGSHLSELAAGMDAGVRVRAGQQVGKVGKTGNANNVCHLHFGISPPCDRTEDWWTRRGVIWPARYLDAWRDRSNRSPVAEVNTWHQKHRCPPAP